ncbi:MAG: nucleotidyltransferase domain-containing protein [Planctomycetes bacterium]|nr:nucleotidyltransferase domain-containing protein [Planctomycetota bacterium]
MPLFPVELQAKIDDIVRRIVRTVQPRRIILFGSAARGDMGPNSDIDLLVVMPDGTHRGRTTEAIYLGLLGVGLATDVIVATESDVARYGANPYLVLGPALREGKDLHRVVG